MPSTQTRERILDVAEKIFAQHGYAATSFRRITSGANVNLAAIYYHFGSKQALFTAVLDRRLRPLNAERLRLLDQLEAESDGRPPVLELVLEAFLTPALALMKNARHGAYSLRLMAQCRLESGEHWRGMDKLTKTAWRRYLSAVGHALPDLPKRELAYRMYFFLGVEVNSLMDRRSLRYLGTGLPDIYAAPDEVIALIVRFVAAGMRSPPLPESSPVPTRRAKTRRASGKEKSRVAKAK